MSRARDNANLGTQAGSGLDASDITSGALGASVTGGAGLAVSTAATSTFAPKAGPTFTGTVAIPNVANLETAVVANTAKTGITSGQASAITANTAKVTNSTNASDLASGTLATARMAAGTMINSKFESFTTSIHTGWAAPMSSPSSGWLDFRTHTFDPISTSSKILVQFFMQSGHVGIVSGTYYFRLFEDVTSDEFARCDYSSGGMSGEQSHGGTGSAFGGVYTNSNTTQKSFKFQYVLIDNMTGSEKFSINISGRTCWCAMQEFE
jgi:hypothetical protein